MAIRYSGDVEVRMRWSKRGRIVWGHVTDGYTPFRTSAARHHAPTPADYDRLAAIFIQRAIRDARRRGRVIQPDVRGGRIRLRRIFQAPCSLSS
jgi:hypothetical protein